MNKNLQFCILFLLTFIFNNAFSQATIEFRISSVSSTVGDMDGFANDSDPAWCFDMLDNTPTEISSEHDGIGLIYGENMWVDCLIPGREYWILVDGEPSLIDPDLVEGLFDIEVFADPQDPPAGNDEPCNAIALGNPTGNPVRTLPSAMHPSQNNFCADAAGEVQPSNWTAYQTVWYTFVAPNTGAVNLEINS
jgi:hypothetical protein